MFQFSQVPCRLTKRLAQVLPPSPSLCPSPGTSCQLHVRAGVRALRGNVRKGQHRRSQHPHRVPFLWTFLTLPSPLFAPPCITGLGPERAGQGRLLSASVAARRHLADRPSFSFMSPAPGDIRHPDDPHVPRNLRIQMFR